MSININRSLLFACNMVDMGFSGPRYTWSNSREVSRLILERLDRFFVNPGWCTMYLNAKVVHLTKVHSDHCPVQLNFDHGDFMRLKRPFKFQRFWLSDLSFPKVVSDAWAQSTHLMEAMEKFTKNATNWNLNYIGNIFMKKRRLMARLNGCQKALATRLSLILVDMEKSLQYDLNEVLSQEQELWTLKSKVNWMLLRDHNTSFFHVLALVWRRRNIITCMKNNVGDRIQEETQIMNFVRKGFEDLYTTSHLMAN